MRYLLDTHTLAWMVGNPTRLSETAYTLLSDVNNDLLVSPVSIWEMSIKYRSGKWPEVAPFIDESLYTQLSQRLRLQELAIRSAHTRLAGQFNLEHKDPFDRLLAAQALLEGTAFISKDAKLDQFPITRAWDAK